MRRRASIALSVAAVAVVLITVRAVAPRAVTRYVNGRLASLGDYRGSVDDVDLYLWRGGYRLRNVRIVKATADGETPFVEVPSIDLSLQWGALMHGSAVGEVIMHEPVLNMVQAKDDREKQLGTGVNWPEAVRDLFPFRLNSVEVLDGLVTFRAPGISTDDSMTMRDCHLLLRNLTNVQQTNREAFADIALEGRVMGSAPIMLTGSIDPNEPTPTFDINVSLERGRLVDVNPWLREFVKVDAEAGVFSMYAELAAADGHVKGYVKPIIEDQKIYERHEDAAGPFQRAWEALVGIAAKVLENRSSREVATEIPYSGEIDNPEAGIVPALVNLLRNAFIAAFTHSLDGSITLRDVAQNLRTLNGSDEGRDEAKDERKQAPERPRHERQRR